jgi:hypothetical protein
VNPVGDTGYLQFVVSTSAIALDYTKISRREPVM